MVTHDIDEAILMADRTLVMAGAPGKIVSDLAVDLDDPRERQDPAVQAMRSNLMQVFHDAAQIQPDSSNIEDNNEAVSESDVISINKNV